MTKKEKDKKKRILVIEDERDMAYAVTLQLNASGYEVINAYDGAAGLKRARHDNPDLIVLDLMLPKMDGYKICGLLKADTRHYKIPIIMFTARAQESDKKMGKDAGADAYINKPFDPQVLLKNIRELLEKKEEM